MDKNKNSDLIQKIKNILSEAIKNTGYEKHQIIGKTAPIIKQQDKDGDTVGYVGGLKTFDFVPTPKSSSHFDSTKKRFLLPRVNPSTAPKAPNYIIPQPKPKVDDATPNMKTPSQPQGGDKAPRIPTFLFNPDNAGAPKPQSPSVAKPQGIDPGIIGPPSIYTPGSSKRLIDRFNKRINPLRSKTPNLSNFEKTPISKNITLSTIRPEDQPKYRS